MLLFSNFPALLNLTTSKNFWNRVSVCLELEFLLEQVS